MIQDTAPISEISHAIQMAVAPVFLLSGVAALIGVLTTRLSRIIDRARVLEGQEKAAGIRCRSCTRNCFICLSARVW